MFEFGPILRTLWRNKTGALLIMLQTALTLAIVVNAAFIITQRQAKIDRPTGVDEANIFTLSVIPTQAGDKHYADVERDMIALNQLPDVVSASIVNSAPLSSSGSTNTMRAEDNKPGIGEVESNVFNTDQRGLDTFGLKLLAGRNFTANDMTVTSSLEGKTPTVCIVTRQLANKLFGKGVDPIGKLVTPGVQVVGVASDTIGAYPNSDVAGDVVLVPQFYTNFNVRYLIRVKPGQLDAMMKKVPDVLNNLDSQRVITSVRSLLSYKRSAYRSDQATISMLSVTMVLISLVTGLGIVGLTLLWVNQRRKQIGTRRALGATKLMVVRYFLVENGIIIGAGIVLGCALALFANHLMVQHYQMKALEVGYLAGGVVAVWLLGLLAALMPAWRAAQVSPSLATRSV